jgi:hypothetical protein
MNLFASIFFEINVPNAATWSYFSLLLAIALFFKFSRLLSVRNLDVLGLFLLVPGLLLLQEGHNLVAIRASGVVAANMEALAGAAAAPGSSVIAIGSDAAATVPPSRLVWYGYVWLLCGSLYYLARCFIDLALVRRPALGPNLNLSGLAWLGGALFICLFAVAIWLRGGPETVGKRSIPVTAAQRSAEKLVETSAETDIMAGRTINTAFWVQRTLAMLCHLAIVAGLVFIGRKHFQDSCSGMAAGTFYLLLPYTAIHVSQVHHVWPTALLVWAVAAYRLPVVSGLLLGLASGSVYFPVLLFPVWFSFYWRRGAGRFAGAFVLSTGVCLAAVLTILWQNQQIADSLQSVLSLPDWQAWKEPIAESFWTGVHWAYRLPAFIVYIAFVFATFFWPWPKNLAHVIAVSAAVLIGIQFWYADQGGVYVLWYLPVLLMMAFRPNLSDREPSPILKETDWLARSGRFFLRHASRLVNYHKPVVSETKRQ